MMQLNYQTLKEQQYDGFLLEHAPERVLQFGEGNFLRAFVDYFIDVLNEQLDFQTKVVLCQPNNPDPAMSDRINEQDGLYTLLLRGFESGHKVNQKRVISAVSRCLNPHRDFDALLSCAENPELRFIVSNTTEAGIVYDPNCQFTDRPAASFPGKLTQLLYRRFQIFGKENDKGFIILPCELIADNGTELKKCVLQYAEQWKLGDDFMKWLHEENLFCSTLVDRIVTGYPKSEADILYKELGYEDHLLDTGEIFAFWVIEGPAFLKKELPFEKAGLPVLITNNHKPYKERKVRILNGAHTSFVLGAYLAGQTIVRDCMEDSIIRGFLQKTIYEEIVPTLTLPKEELEDFAAAVLDRFQNPFIDHALLSIALNSTSKWKARILPTLKDYVKNTGTLPACLTASFAFYLAFYRREDLIKDDPEIMDFYKKHKSDTNKELVHAVCANEAFWGEDLTALPGFEDAVTAYLDEIDLHGTYEAMKRHLF